MFSYNRIHTLKWGYEHVCCNHGNRANGGVIPMCMSVHGIEYCYLASSQISCYYNIIKFSMSSSACTMGGLWIWGMMQLKHNTPGEYQDPHSNFASSISLVFYHKSLESIPQSHGLGFTFVPCWYKSQIRARMEEVPV